MDKFYITYPQRLAHLANCFSVIEASTYDEAYHKVHAAIGSAWAFLYTHEQFMGATTVLGIKYPSQVEAFGLREIPLGADNDN